MDKPTKTSKSSLYVLSGASGSGKSTIAAQIAKQQKATLSVSYSTRQPHSSEIDGLNYHFVSQAEFTKLRQTDQLLECANVYGNWYGTSKQLVNDLLEADNNVLLEIDVQGATQVNQLMTESHLVFILPPSMDELHHRILVRGRDDAEQIKIRMTEAIREIGLISQFDYLVVNSDIIQATDDIASIIDGDGEQFLTTAQPELVNEWQTTIKNANLE